MNDDSTQSSIREPEDEDIDNQGTRLASLAQAAWDVVWLLHPDGRMWEAGQWSTFTGQPVIEATAYGWLAALHPDDRAPVEIWLRAALGQGVRDEIECRLQKAQAAHSLLRLQLYPQLTGSVVKSWLVCGTELSRVQQHKVFGAEHYRLAMESGGVGLWDWDLIRNQLVWSAECKAIFGVSPSARASYPFLLQLLHPEDRNDVNQAVTHSLEQQQDFNMAFRTIWPRDESVHWVESRGRGLYDLAGKPLRFIGVVSDITDQKQALEDNKDAFIGVVSHELRTPLTAIKGNIQLVRRQLRTIAKSRQSLPEKANRIIEASEARIGRALHQIEMQNRLINDLLDVSRIAANKLELAPQLCDLKQLTIASVEDVRATAAMRTIHLQIPDIEAILILADPDRIGQVISNYVTNAVKYSDPKEPVTVGIDIESNRVRVWVEDHGPGLNEEVQQHVWDRFYQARGIQVRSGSGSGLGLGLHICHTLIKRHGGDLGVDSIPGQGSTFWFTLPLEM